MTTVFLCLGLAQLSIESLETKTEARGVVDLMEEKGRRPVGGKLEVVARLREPLTGESVGLVKGH